VERKDIRVSKGEMGDWRLKWLYGEVCVDRVVYRRDTHIDIPVHNLIRIGFGDCDAVDGCGCRHLAGGCWVALD
jgi:hypothetical protein